MIGSGPSNSPSQGEYPPLLYLQAEARVSGLDQQAVVEDCDLSRRRQLSAHVKMK